ncbi:MAG TPA: hypothetical protein VFL14_03005 [Xanthomonadales bacterium]|nr:hypothetical protein [Xanthomonadales bacterium]
MNTPTRALACAVASLFACLAVDAGAVSLNPRGSGQVLLFPYYTANGGNQTLLTLVNSTDRAKALKVRFHEARNGRAVYELNLYLAAYDTWSAAVFASGTQGVAKLASRDASCTTGFPDTVASGLRTAEFSADAYRGANQDWNSAGTPAGEAERLAAPERTRDGYVEVIEMGELQAGTAPLQLAEEVDPARFGFSCVDVQAAWAVSDANNWSDDPAQAIDLPRGGLFGNGAVIDVALGSMFTYNATALDDFYTYAAAPGALNHAAGSGRPDLRDARNGVDFARARPIGFAASGVQEQFPLERAIDAVSLAILQETVSNEFLVDPALGSANEWVFSLPTRRFYSDVASDALVVPPFTDAFRDDGSGTEQLRVEYFDREARIPAPPPATCDVTACPPVTQRIPSLDDAVNVVVWALSPDTVFAPSPILGASFLANAQLIRPVRVGNESFLSGRAFVTVDDPVSIATDHLLRVPNTGRAYVGLPVLGFAVTRIVNASASPGLLANYGDAVEHAGGDVRSIVVPATEGQP